MTRQPRILVIGSVNMDLVFRVPALPRKGENVLATQSLRVSGGKGANQAVAAARLGGEVYLAGKIGADAFGEELRTRLAGEGLHLDHLTRADVATGTAFITTDARGDNTIVVDAGANAAMTAADIDALAEEIRSADVVLLQLEIPAEAVCRALALARSLGVRAVVDAGPAQAFPLADLASAWLVSPNETEAGALLGETFTGLEAAREAARRLVLAGLPQVLLKLGADGALLARRAQGNDSARARNPADSADSVDSVEIRHFPAFPVAAVDTTAAGDAFTAALGFRLALGEPLDQAIVYANAAGALTATRLGAQPSLPTAVEVAGFLKERAVYET